VVAFAGDALICVFVDQPAPTSEELEASLTDDIMEASHSFVDGIPSINSYCSDASQSSCTDWRSASRKSPYHPAQTEEAYPSAEEELSLSASRQREISNQKAHRKAMDILRQESQQSRRFSNGKETTSSARHDSSDTAADNSLPNVGAMYGGDSDTQPFDVNNPNRARHGSVEAVDLAASSPNIYGTGIIDMASSQSIRTGSNVFTRHGSHGSVSSEHAALNTHGSPVKHHRPSDPNVNPGHISPSKSDVSSTGKTEAGSMSRVLSRVLSRRSLDLMSPPRRGSTDDDHSSPNRSHRSSISESKPIKIENPNAASSSSFTNDASILNQRRPSMLYLDKLEESQSENNSPMATSKTFIQQHRPKNPLDPDPYLQKNCCLRALECAMLLREQSAHSGTLTTHIAVSYGEMKLAILGGHNDDWVYLLNGECISELGPCLNAAGKKQVVATRRCYEYACQSKGFDLTSKIETFHTFSSTTSAENMTAYTASDPCMIQPSLSSSFSQRVVQNPSLDQTTISTSGSSSQHKLISVPTSSSSPSKSMKPSMKNSSLMLTSISSDELSPRATTDNEETAATATNEPFDFSPLYFHPSAMRSNPKSSASSSSSYRQMSSSKTTMKKKQSYPEIIDENSTVQIPAIHASSGPASVSAVNMSLHHVASFGITSANIASLPTFSQPKDSSLMFGNRIKTTQVEDNYVIEAIATNRIPAEHPMRLKRILHKSPPTVVDAAKLFVSRPVLSAIYSDSLDRTAELRQVVTMFVSLDSYSPADHKDPLELQPFFKVVQEALHQSGGYLRQFVVDDKGCVVVAMWGVPQFSYSNNSLRGLFCGVAISRRSQQLSLKTSVGLTSGYCYCGCVGGRIRRDYAIIGDQVNMAARLMAKANGKVLMDMQLRDNLPSNIQHQLGRAEVMKLKGARGPVQPYVYAGFEIPVTDVLEDHEGQTTVLRRQVRLMLSSQLDKISNVSKAADQAKQSGKQSIHKSVRLANNHAAPITHSVIVTVIIGLPGTGKSTAAQYFEQESRKRNIDCIKIQARPGEETRPYSVIRKLFLELIGIGNFREEWQQRSIIREVIREAYSSESDEERLNAELTLEIILGLDWSEAFRTFYTDDADGDFEGGGDPSAQYSYQDSDDHSLDPSTYEHAQAATNTDPDLSQPSVATTANAAAAVNRKLRLKVGDMTFYNVLRALLKNRKTVIIIEDADYCDELSWNEFYLILVGNDLQLAMLLTMRTPPSRTSSGHHHGQGLQQASSSISQHSRKSLFQSSIPPHHNPSSSNLMEDLPTVTITRASGESVIVSIAEFDTTGLIVPNHHHNENNANNHVNINNMNKYGMIKFRPNNSYLSILAHNRCKVIEMNPLNEAEINELLQEALQIDEVDPELVMSVLEVTAGNAFWCKAIARFIRENGIEEYSRTIVRRGGNFNSLRALILNRIDRLSAEQQIVAKHASIIGDEFTLSVLKAILPNKIQTHLSQSLEALQHNGLVYCVEEGHEIIFSFQNQLIRNTIYDLTPPT
jgi:class 3 adenylate cyclase